MKQVGKTKEGRERRGESGWTKRNKRGREDDETVVK
jgi:hypothetical protein